MNIKEDQLKNINKLQIANKKTWKKVAGKILLITAPLILVSGQVIALKTQGVATIPFVREEVTGYKHARIELNQAEQIITFEDYLPSKDVVNSFLIQKEPIKFESSQFRQNVITYTINDFDIELLNEAIINNDISLVVKYIKQKISQTEEVVIPYDKNDIINNGELSAVVNIVDINDSKVVLERPLDDAVITTLYIIELLLLSGINMAITIHKTGNKFYNVKKDLEDIYFNNEEIKELKLK